MCFACLDNVSNLQVELYDEAGIAAFKSQGKEGADKPTPVHSFSLVHPVRNTLYNVYLCKRIKQSSPLESLA